jgi:hypothetical protein
MIFSRCHAMQRLILAGNISVVAPAGGGYYRRASIVVNSLAECGKSVEQKSKKSSKNLQKNLKNVSKRFQKSFIKISNKFQKQNRLTTLGVRRAMKNGSGIRSPWQIGFMKAGFIRSEFFPNVTEKWNGFMPLFHQFQFSPLRKTKT